MTILAYEGGLYHKKCLDDEQLAASVREIAIDEIEDDQVCDECMELLVSAEDEPEEEKDVETA